LLPSLIGIAIIRALAPLITALVATGKVGSNIGAELGSMKVTEQIDAMEVSGTDPFKFLVVSRVLATTLMIPVLVVYTAFVGLTGSYINVHTNEQTSWITFIQNAFSQLSFLDFSATIIKAIVFGFTIGIARTLIMNPEVMLYDEPTAGLDPITSVEINNLFWMYRSSITPVLL